MKLKLKLWWPIGLCLMGAVLFGWLFNVVKLIASTEPTGLLIVRACGIFLPPLGVVLGFF